MKIIFCAILALVAGILLEGATIMWLWNWIIVDLFNVEPIEYWFGVGIGLVFALIGSYFHNAGGKNNG